MVIEALQSYAQMASGLTRTTREKATATAKGLLDQAGLGEAAADASDRVTKLAEELLATSKANRQLLTNFVDAEVQKAVDRIGLAKAEDIDDLRAEIAELRAASVAAVVAVASAPATEPPPAAAAAPAVKRPAKKAPAKKASSAKVATHAAPASSETAAPAPAAKRPAKKAPAKTAAKNAPAKAAAKKAPAKKSPAKKSPAKKAAVSSDASDAAS